MNMFIAHEHTMGLWDHVNIEVITHKCHVLIWECVYGNI